MNTHLYRSRDDRMLAGVAGGLAELWDADPSLVRIIWALLVVLTGGIALVVYIVMAIVVPDENDVAPWTARRTGPDAGAGSPVAGSSDATAAPATNAFVDARTVDAAATGPAGGAPGSEDWRPSRFEAREMRRAARMEARAARRANHGNEGRTGAMVVGLLLILIGSWYLVRQYLPTVDWDWFWPLALVALGLVVLFLAIRPRPATDDRGETDRSGGS